MFYTLLKKNVNNVLVYKSLLLREYTVQIGSYVIVLLCGYCDLTGLVVIRLGYFFAWHCTALAWSSV